MEVCSLGKIEKQKCNIGNEIFTYKVDVHFTGTAEHAYCNAFDHFLVGDETDLRFKVLRFT